MKANEFSLEFDVLYNNIMSDVAPGLNAYEKSVFLTKAQEALVLQLYNGNTNSFEVGEIDRKFLSNLVKEVAPLYMSSTTKNSLLYTSYKLPEDHLFTTYEYVNSDGESCSSDGVDIIPTRLDELRHYIRNPFKGIKANDILRLDKEGDVLLVSKQPVKDYSIYYLRKPYPIILEDLEEEGVSINGKTKPLSEEEVCELPDILHRQIIIQAVQMAKLVWNN